jgi:hypothetical protein
MRKNDEFLFKKVLWSVYVPRPPCEQGEAGGCVCLPCPVGRNYRTGVANILNTGGMMQ